jgi:D-3-phosphoglycerate dehydrogenase|tara:strand:+ start:1529 stop:2716 length:1188 start_codon:yes stop_codon:yes gene_type:complete
MKVLLNDGMDEEGVELFNEAGIEVDLEKKSRSELIEKIGEYDALIVRSQTKDVNSEIIVPGYKGNLKMIGRSGVGYDNIDWEFAKEQAIVVKNAPNGVTNATAEMALGIMLGVARNIPQADASLKDGKWLKKLYTGVELSYKTLGVFGGGRIGKRLIKLVEGFGMKIICCDPFSQKDTSISYVSKEEVLKNADFLSIHAAGDEVLIGRDELEIMKPTAYLVNTARGNKVDPEALYDALANKRIAGAALDVHMIEGSSFKNKFEGLDNLVITPHLGASTKKGQRATAIEMAKVTIGYLKKGDFTNAVNMGDTIDSEQKPSYIVFIHHEDIPGVFSKIDGVFGDHGINIREFNSRKLYEDGAEGKKCALTDYLLQNEVTNQVIEKIREIPTVYSAKI